MTEVQSEPNAAARTCGSCSLCCFTHMVRPREGESFEQKEGDTWCKHCVQGSGCGIYATRPIACQEFECGWLVGLGTEEERPDKTQVVMHRFHISERAFIVRMTEAAPDALQAPSIQRVIQERLRAGDLVSLHHPNGVVECLAHRNTRVPFWVQVECMEKGITVQRVD